MNTGFIHNIAHVVINAYVSVAMVNLGSIV